MCGQLEADAWIKGRHFFLNKLKLCIIILRTNVEYAMYTCAMYFTLKAQL